MLTYGLLRTCATLIIEERSSPPQAKALSPRRN